MNSNPNFKLPPDLVIQVIKHLDPIDILAVRAVRRALIFVLSMNLIKSRGAVYFILSQPLDQSG
jgi:hypothetical protein